MVVTNCSRTFVETASSFCASVLSAWVGWVVYIVHVCRALTIISHNTLRSRCINNNQHYRHLVSEIEFSILTLMYHQYSCLLVEKCLPLCGLVSMDPDSLAKKMFVDNVKIFIGEGQLILFMPMFLLNLENSNPRSTLTDVCSI